MNFRRKSDSSNCHSFRSLPRIPAFGLRWSKSENCGVDWCPAAPAAGADRGTTSTGPKENPPHGGLVDLEAQGRGLPGHRLNFNYLVGSGWDRKQAAAILRHVGARLGRRHVGAGRGTDPARGGWGSRRSPAPFSFTREPESQLFEMLNWS